MIRSRAPSAGRKVALAAVWSALMASAIISAGAAARVADPPDAQIAVGGRFYGAGNRGRRQRRGDDGPG